MEITSFRYFLRAMELESISRAAAVLGVTQPALSRHISAVEKELGQRLLIRTGRGVVPTDAGRRFGAEAARILEEVDALGAAVVSGGDIASGAVSLALPASIGDGLLPALFELLGRDYPDIQLKVREALSSVSSNWLRDRTIDIAVLYERDDLGALHVETLIDEPLCVVSPPGAWLSLEPSIRFAEVGQLQLILPSRSSGLRRLLETETARHGVKWQVAVELDAVAAIKNLVATGLGHTILPQLSVVRNVAAGLMEARRISDPALTRRLVIARLPHRRLTLPIRKVVQCIREVTERYVLNLH